MVLQPQARQLTTDVVVLSIDPTSVVTALLHS